MIINQIASGGGGGLDTSNATAYPEHILKDYTAYGRGVKLTGTYEPPSPKEVPVILASNSVETSSGTSLSITITATVGNLIILAVTTRDNITSITASWTQMVESPHIIASACEQRNYIYYKIAAATSETVTVTQASAQRLYLTGLCFDTTTIPTVDTALSVLSPTYNYIQYTKTNNRCYIVVISTYYWTTASPYPLWVSAPIVYKNFQLSTAQSRLGVFVDDETPTSRTINGPAAGTTEGHKVTMCAVYF